jgi:uncharacterized secreted repeat protein (TIGR03808 family)
MMKCVSAEHCRFRMDGTMLLRRDFLQIARTGVLVAAASPALAGKLNLAPAELRGSIDAVKNGLSPDTSDDQGKTLNKLIRMAAQAKAQLFLPPGNYHVSNLDLPDETRIVGVPGASRLVYGGDGHLGMAENVRRIELNGLVIDGAHRRLADYCKAILHLTHVDMVHIDNCEITGSGKFGLWLENCGGRISDNQISGASEAGIYVVQSRAMTITGNIVSRCGNGGILAHRWTKADDGTIISGNRISDIAAKSGGTGENGNGINIFRADNVMISNNVISGCAFSAIRSNAGSNVQILGNQCRASGETAIYSEFGFEGAIVANNLVDGAANGISIVNFNEGGRLATVTGNILRNLSTTGPYPAQGMGFGIGIAAEADTAITGNVIENAPKCGLLLGWGTFLRDVTATGNVVRNSPVGCAITIVEGAGAALLSGNLFENTPKGAILGYRWTEPATPELASASATTFSNVTLASNLATNP